jgi:DHA1 family bicyclomycin/chloramphenicol resistance-like MFS transporter
VARHAKRAGSASALLGNPAIRPGGAGRALVGALTEGTARPMAILMLLGIASRSGRIGARNADPAA